MKSLIAFAVLFLPSFLLAQDHSPAEIQARLASIAARWHDLQGRHTTKVRFSEDPAGIPRGEVLRMYFLQLRAETRSRDDIAFRQFTIDRFAATESDTQVLKQALVGVDAEEAKLSAIGNDICPHVLDESVTDGRRIAEYFAQANQQGYQSSETDYQAFIDKLSPAARAGLLQNAGESSLRFVFGTLDDIGAASEDPDLYATMMKAACRAQKNTSAGQSQIQTSPHNGAAQ